MRMVWMLGVASLAAACAPEAEKQEASPPAATASVPAPPEPGPSAVPVDRKVAERNNTFEFEYSWPAAVAAIPDLAVELEADLAQRRREIARDAREGQRLARTDGYPFNPYSYSLNWSVVTELPGWLSLSGWGSIYTGGAHPNHWSQALLWDKAAGKSRQAVDLFASKAALSEAIRAPFCAALNRERAARRGEPVRADSGAPFSDCIDPTASTVILGSSNGQQFDRIGVLIAPYEAGPYAEGDYEITLPVTRAVLAVVKPQYRAVFAPGR